MVMRGEQEVNIYSRSKFVDAMNFMKSPSLKKLASSSEKNMFKHTIKYFNSDELDLMVRKGIYPYEYMTDISKLKEMELPPIEHLHCGWVQVCGERPA